ncbi:hypothetical protein [Culicoidibacter larvae]|nr:hypothetical protein [Culicoidibacter larvae]
MSKEARKTPLVQRVVSLAMVALIIGGAFMSVITLILYISTGQ